MFLKYNELSDNSVITRYYPFNKQYTTLKRSWMLVQYWCGKRAEICSYNIRISRQILKGSRCILIVAIGKWFYMRHHNQLLVKYFDHFPTKILCNMCRLYTVEAMTSYWRPREKIIDKKFAVNHITNFVDYEPIFRFSYVNL